MKFDCTKGAAPKYMVSMYGWNVGDQYYFHSFNEAKRFFDKMKEIQPEETYLSLYDMTKDTRKMFLKKGE